MTTRLHTGARVQRLTSVETWKESYTGKDSTCDLLLKSTCLSCPLPECIHVINDKKAAK